MMNVLSGVIVSGSKPDVREYDAGSDGTRGGMLATVLAMAAM
jgi:hypothetical protein